MRRVGHGLENVSPLRAYSRSRKCVDLATDKGKLLSPRVNPCNMSNDVTSPSNLVLSSSDQEDTPGSPSSYLPLLSEAQTPRTPLARKFSLDNKRVEIKRRTLGALETIKQTPLKGEPAMLDEDHQGGIVVGSFYTNHLKSEKNSNFDFLRVTGDANCDLKTPNMGSNVRKEVRSHPGPLSKAKSGPILRRSSNKGSLRRRSTGGCKSDKRKRNSIGHGIKKPKFKRKVESVKVKISELPVLSVELPKFSSSVSPSNAGTRSYDHPKNVEDAHHIPSSKINSNIHVKSAATSGELNITKQTKVKYEVKGGQLVFRATPKAGITPRRSPRKHMSPLKADYFREERKRKRSPGGTSQKLFSPNSNYLDETVHGAPKNLPSPVKFHDLSQSDTVPDLTDVIDSLGGNESEASAENNPRILLTTECQEEICIKDNLPVAKYTTFTSVPDVSSAVTSILDDLTDGDSSMDTTGSSISVDVTPNNATINEESSTKLYPVFRSNSTDPKVNESVRQLDMKGKSFICSSLDDDQAVIDAGQKEIGPVSCGVCGVIYSKGDPEDETSHNKFHNGLLDKLRMVGWKQERVVGSFPNGRVIMIKPGDPVSWWKKVEEVLQVVDNDLGFAEIGIRKPEVTKVYFFVSDKKVVGFLLAEEVEKGYRMISNEGMEAVKGFCCSEVGEPVKTGVSRIWVFKDYRRTKVASSLVDCMRSSFYGNHYLKDSEFAFSDPTLHGIEFARRYCNSHEFLVYNR